MEFLTHMTSSEPWINTTKYSIPVLILFLLGCSFWGVVYAMIFKEARTKHTVEYPMMAMACAFGWEILMGLGIVRVTDMGKLFQFAYFLWFFFDCFIFYMMLKYGYKQIRSAQGQRMFTFLYFFCIAAWLVMWYPFMKSYDDPIGAYSGWVCNVVISSCFVFQKINNPAWGTNRWIAILKFLGTGSCSAVVFGNYYDNPTLVACVFVFSAFDLVYIYLVFKGPKTDEIPSEMIPT